MLSAGSVGARKLSDFDSSYLFDFVEPHMCYAHYGHLDDFKKDS